MGKSDFLERKVLDHILGGPDYARPATVYIALYTDSGSLSDSSTGTTPGGTAAEVSGGAYERLAVTNDDSEFPAASGDPTVKTNANALYWPVATDDWPAVAHWAITDAATGGEILYHGTLENPRTILSGDQLFIAAGLLTIQED